MSPNGREGDAASSDWWIVEEGSELAGDRERDIRKIGKRFRNKDKWATKRGSDCRQGVVQNYSQSGN